MPTSSSSKAILAALDGPEWDSSDDDGEEIMDNVEAESEKIKESKKSGKTKKKKSTSAAASNVIYLGHLPVGFEEGELRGFLSQFGQVSKLKLARSKKTGNPKGYAFCKFDDAEVAAIVAETMSGYLLLEKRLVCHVVPQEKVHDGLFSKQAKTDIQTRRKLHAQQVNQKRTSKQLSKITERLFRREKKKRTVLLEQFGYDFPGYNKESTSDAGMEKQARKVSIDKDEVVENKPKRKRKMSIEQKADKDDETPSKKIIKPSSETDVKKRKRKSSKKRRQSAP